MNLLNLLFLLFFSKFGLEGFDPMHPKAQFSHKNNVKISFGIIDILQTFVTRKKAEHGWKSWIPSENLVQKLNEKIIKIINSNLEFPFLPLHQTWPSNLCKFSQKKTNNILFIYLF